MTLSKLTLALALAASAFTPAAATVAKPGEAASDKEAMLLVVCRVWAKTNVQVLETESAYWSGYYTRAYDRLMAMGYDPKAVASVQESKSKQMNADMREPLALYIDYLNYKLAKQAADYRAKTFGGLDKECKAALR